MKYKTGDKVKYGSGDWLFSGTVTAVSENSINPCYRISVERMENTNCKFSITQFEFEIESGNQINDDAGEGKWEKSENKFFEKSNIFRSNENLSAEIKPATEQKEPVQEAAQKPKPFTPRKQKRIHKNISPIKDKPKRKKGEAWQKNFEMYRNGERNGSIYSWMSINRSQYRTGNLQETKLEKLMEINFPFKVKKRRSKQTPPPEKRKSSFSWEQQFKRWQEGERDSLQQWRQRSVRQYLEGKLPKERIEKLTEIGIIT